MLINRRNLSVLFTGLKRNFERGLTSRDDFNLYRRMATMVRSTQSIEEYPWLGQFPRMREWLGDRIIKQLEAHNYSIKNRKFESTIQVLRDNLEDDSYGIYAPMAEEMGIAAAELPNDLVFSILKDAENAVGYDGQPFFSTTHPEGDATASNFVSGAGDAWYLFDDSRPLKPFIYQQRIAPQMQRKDSVDDEQAFMRDVFLYGIRARGAAGLGLWQLAYKSEAALDETNFDAAYADMMSRKNDEGSDLGIQPRLLVVPPSLRAAAKQLIETQLTTNGGSNRNFAAVDVVVTSRL
jgi:phage major head subunit gpT-like protein